MYRILRNNKDIVAFNVSGNSITDVEFLTEDTNPIYSARDIAAQIINTYGRLALSINCMPKTLLTIEHMVKSLSNYKMYSYIQVVGQTKQEKEYVMHQSLRYLPDKQLGHVYMARQIYTLIFGDMVGCSMSYIDCKTATLLGLVGKNHDLIYLYHMLTLQRFDSNALCVITTKEQEEIVVPAPVFNFAFYNFVYWKNIDSVRDLEKELKISCSRVSYRFHKVLCDVRKFKWGKITPVGDFTVSYYTDIISFVDDLADRLQQCYGS